MEVGEFVYKGKFVKKIFLSDKAKWSSKNLQKIISADVKADVKQEIKELNNILSVKNNGWGGGVG